MAFDAHSNFGYSTVAVAPAPANSGTSLQVAAGQGVLFPAAPFNCTLWPPGVNPLSSNAEIVRVTAIVGDTLTIVRAQEGSSAVNAAVGYQIANTTSNKVFTDIETQVDTNTANIATNTADIATNTADIATLQTSKQDADQALTDLSNAALVQGDILYQNATNLVRLPAGVAGQLLETAGPAANPAWVNPPSGGGDLLAANNLSDVANAATSRQNLGLEIGVDVQAQDQALQDVADAAFVQGDIIYRNATNLTRLPAGTSGDVLQTQGAGANPIWAAPGGGSSIDSGTFAARPAAGTAGRLYLPTDGITQALDDGAAWLPWGPMWAFTPPVNADFAWVNQGGASVTDNYGVIRLVSDTPAAAQNLRIRVKTAPATPYTITAAMLVSRYLLATLIAGLCFRESGTGEISSMAVAFGNTIAGIGYVSSNYTNPTTFSANNANTTVMPPEVIWLRITDDGANRISQYSIDGLYWVTFFTVARTTFLTADQVGFFVNAAFANPTPGVLATLTLLSWKET